MKKDAPYLVAFDVLTLPIGTLFSVVDNIEPKRKFIDFEENTNILPYSIKKKVYKIKGNNCTVYTAPVF